MRNILFIAYYFPPLGGAGVQKSLKFVKYLRKCNYNPIVLTVNPMFTRWVKDYSLLKEIPSNTEVYRTPTIDMNWIYKLLWGLKLNKVVKWMQLNLFIPDSEITWLPFARASINKIMKKHKIDLAYITGGPFSAMLLGPYLLIKHKIKYVLDFRDEWTNNPTRLDSTYPSRLHIRELELEKDIIFNSSAIIYTIPKYMKENFESKYTFLNEKLSCIITNGYDDDDFNNVQINQQKIINKCHLVYTGTFYDRRQPTILWKAIHELGTENANVHNDLLIEIIGKNSKSFVLGGYVSNETICNIVRFHPNMERKRALNKLVSANALLLYIAPGKNSKAEMTGKLFDYLKVYKPIIAFVPPDGVAADIIRKSRTGYVYDSSNLEDVKKGWLHIYNLWKENKLSINPDMEYISQFDRKILTKKLASIFDQVLESKIINKNIIE